MKTLKKSIYLILGLFVFGLVSCANDSGSTDTYVPARNTDTDKNGQKYTDGFYKFDDGNTQLYLYYENRNLVSAGNAQGKLPSSQIEILKQSYTWNTVCKYCTRYEVNLYSTKWMLGVYPAEKLFKKGWYKIKISENSEYYVGYFESYNSSMTYAKYYINENAIYRTNNFNITDYYSPNTWNSFLKDFADSSYSNACFELLSENLDYYTEQ